MSKLTERLRNIEIYNLYDLVSDGHPMVAYMSADYSRGGHGGPKWNLSIKNRSFKNVHWAQHGCLWFSVDSQTNREQALAQAMAKVKQIVPDLEMVKSPFPMSYVPRVDLERVMAELKAFEKEHPIAKANT